MTTSATPASTPPGPPESTATPPSFGLRLVYITLPLAVIFVVALFALMHQWAERQLTDLKHQEQLTEIARGSSGGYFGVDGDEIVEVAFVFPTQARRGDSIPVILTLDDTGRKKSKDYCGGCAIESGSMTPTLNAGDCTVTAQPRAAKLTSLPTAGFVWLWSVDDCKSAGSKALQVLLAFDDAPGAGGAGDTSDPVAFRGLGFIEVTDPFSAENVTAAIALISGLLTVASGITEIVVKSRG